jgi:hypothetical protein
VQTQEDLHQLLRGLAEPIAEMSGVELVDIAVRGTGGRQLVKVIVDQKGGVDLATCQRISQTLSTLRCSRSLGSAAETPGESLARFGTATRGLGNAKRLRGT